MHKAGECDAVCVANIGDCRALPDSFFLHGKWSVKRLWRCRWDPETAIRLYLVEMFQQKQRLVWLLKL
jgi:hypothetical protein